MQVSIAKINKSENRCRQGCGKRKLIHCCLQIDTVTLDISERNLKKLKTILPYHPDIPFFDVSPKELTSCSTELTSYSVTFIAEAIITHANTKVGKSPISTTREKQQVINDCREMEN